MNAKMDPNRWQLILPIAIMLLLSACQGWTKNPEASPTLPAPGKSVIQPEPTSTESTLKGGNEALETAVESEPGDMPPYVQGSSGYELVPMPEATIIYYDIEGTTEEELRAQLDELGPVDFSGYKGDAVTDWYIAWNWPGYGSDNCSLSEADVSYTVKVLFPRWNPPADAANNLIIKWFNYTYRLAVHEKGHVDSVVTSYQDVLAAIDGATCGTADAAAQAVIESLRASDLEYDRQIGHGATQGARFP